MRPQVDISPGAFVQVPKGATEQEVESLENALADARLNERIRQYYESLKDESGRFPDGFRAARKQTANRFAVSEARVRRAVSGA